MDYRREVDGLRAVAVLPVLFFHAGFPGFSGGFSGVDVFFVISGYLITALILDDVARDSFSVSRFYERRARRILPALFVVTICTAIGAVVLMLPDALARFGESAGAMALFLSNFYFLTKVDYFAPAAELQPLLHTWSLAVEEQFYLFFPLLLTRIWRLGRRATLWFLAAVFVASLMLAVWGGGKDAARNFFFTGSRIWELAVGAFCAAATHRRNVAPGQMLSLLGLAMILVAMVVFDKATPTPGLPTLLPVLGTALVLTWGQRGTLVAAVLSHPILVGVGLISYSAYLWHFPVFVLTQIAIESTPSMAMKVGLVAGTLGLATLSWRFVEQPFRRGGPHMLLPRRKDVFRVSGLAMLALLAAGLAARQTDGFLVAWRAVYPDRALLMDTIEQARANRDLPADDGACRFLADELTAEAIARMSACADRHGPGIGILGDSHAIDVFGLVTGRPDSPVFVAAIAKPACRPSDDPDDCPYSALTELLETGPPLFSEIIFSQSGAYLFESGDRNLSVQERLVAMPTHAPVPMLSPDQTQIDDVLSYLSRVREHIPVVWFGPRVEPQIRLDQFVRVGCNGSWLPRPGTSELFEALDSRLEQDSAAAGIPYVSQIRALSLTFPRDYGTCEALFWSDEDHYSAEGEMHFGARVNLVDEARRTTGGLAIAPVRPALP